MKLYVWKTCPFCVKVIRFIEKNNIDIEIVYIGYDHNSRKMIEDKAGMFQVPLLEYDGKYMYESKDIIKYLQS